MSKRLHRLLLLLPLPRRLRHDHCFLSHVQFVLLDRLFFLPFLVDTEEEQKTYFLLCTPENVLFIFIHIHTYT